MNFFTRISDHYTELVNFIIRPPRDRYKISDLGPQKFPMARRNYVRTDLVLTNRRNQKLHCSHFEPSTEHRPSKRLPVVIYMHGNCSSRMESLSILPVLLPQNITVFAMDFCGSGLSDGEYVSLGYYEREDLALAIEHLRRNGTSSCIGLWGRSMGAVTALMHADRDPSIAGLVVDSPFSSLRKLSEELADTVLQWKVPRFLLGTILGMVRSSVQSRAHFDIYDLAPIDHVRKAFAPAMFITAAYDNFIPSHHGKELSTYYAGENTYHCIEGDHNSSRPKAILSKVAQFFHRALFCEGAASAKAKSARMHDQKINICKQVQDMSKKPPEKDVPKSKKLNMVAPERGTFTPLTHSKSQLGIETSRSNVLPMPLNYNNSPRSNNNRQSPMSSCRPTPMPSSRHTPLPSARQTPMSSSRSQSPPDAASRAQVVNAEHGQIRRQTAPPTKEQPVVRPKIPEPRTDIVKPTLNKLVRSNTTNQIDIPNLETHEYVPTPNNVDAMRRPDQAYKFTSGNTGDIHFVGPNDSDSDDDELIQRVLEISLHDQ